MTYRIVQVQPGEDGGTPFHDVVSHHTEVEALIDGGGRVLREIPLNLPEPLEELFAAIRRIQEVGGDILAGHSIDSLLVHLFEAGQASVSD